MKHFIGKIPEHCITDIKIYYNQLIKHNDLAINKIIYIVKIIISSIIYNSSKKNEMFTYISNNSINISVNKYGIYVKIGKKNFMFDVYSNDIYVLKNIFFNISINTLTFNINLETNNDNNISYKPNIKFIC
jgi:hypothetical protein